MIPEKLLKPYDPTETESRVYKMWEESGVFNPDICIEKGYTDKNAEPFTIIMPPPNANGRLHAGHAMFISVEDMMTRFARMRGYKTLWVPGADHAGFETQIVYENKLEKEGRTRFDIPREQLYKEIYDFTIENKKYMEDDVRRIGASCDWSREKFTLDPEVVSVVQDTFRKMYKDGFVYRGKKIINWCSKHQTSLSDVETEFIEQEDPFYYLKFGPFEIGTSRPETKFGDKYIVVNPDDKRYAQYKDGQQFDVEWINGKITATLIKDKAIDMEFGTGAMTITPWHDMADFEIAQRHGLEGQQVIDFKGKLLPIAGEGFAGIHIKKARPLIVEKLKSKELLIRVDEKYKHNIKCCYKCNTQIEPQIKDQWFIKMKPLAELALKAVKNKKVEFIPENYEKIFTYWMENTLDWNISRQIVWGIPIPAKICPDCNEGYLDMEASIKCSKCGKELIQDTDTFDTWFSSGQWPLLSLGFKHNNLTDKSADFNTYHPTNIMETGRDLIFKWVPRMVFFSLYLINQVPFKTVYLHGLANDAKGKKMSKSKGNVISPIDISDKFGADALRMSLIVGNTPGNDFPVSEQKIMAYKKFANKLWNITRFILSGLEDYEGSAEKSEKLNEKNFSESDLKILVEHDKFLADITKEIIEFKYHIASEKIYHYIWHTLADVIIEDSKDILGSFDKPVPDVPEKLIAKKSRQAVLAKILRESIIVLHPFMPFVTEEIWSLLPKQVKMSETMLIVEKWPVK